MKILIGILDLINGTWSLIFKLAIVIAVIIALVGFINSCTANATLSEHSSCQQFDQADTATQDRVLGNMMVAHHDQESLSLTRFSVRLYCNFHSEDAPIDGVYGSSDLYPQSGQALRLPVPLAEIKVE